VGSPFLCSNSAKLLWLDGSAAKFSLFVQEHLKELAVVVPVGGLEASEASEVPSELVLAELGVDAASAVLFGPAAFAVAAVSAGAVASAGPAVHGVQAVAVAQVVLAEAALEKPMYLRMLLKVLEPGSAASQAASALVVVVVFESLVVAEQREGQVAVLAYLTVQGALAEVLVACEGCCAASNCC